MKNRVLSPNTIIPADLYVERAADRQLQSVIDEMGRPAYILVARQMGKTNLLLNMKRNRQDDFVVYFDLSNRFETARGFFRNIIDTIIESSLDVFGSIHSIEHQRKDNVLEPSVEYDRHLRLLLRACGKKIVLILDEIDSLIGCSYSDTILSQVRSMYFSRGNFEIYKNLTYVLSGVADPSDLIKDRNISPFNIGEKIYLEDFTKLEFFNFVKVAKLDVGQDIVERIFWWADGNPRISWDICSEVELERIKDVEITCASIDEIIERLYLREYDRAPIDHIRTLVEFDSEIRKAIMSIKYSRSDFADDKVRGKLYLAGIAKSDGHKGIIIKNRVVDAALSERWIQQLDNTKVSLADEATRAFAARDYAKAVKFYDEILASKQDLSDAQMLELGEAHLNTEKLDEALCEFDVVASRTSDDKLRQLAMLQSGLTNLLLKNNRVSLEKFKSAAQGPDLALSITARLNLQVIYGRIGEAEQSFDAISMSLDLVTEIGQLKEPDQHYLFTTALANLAALYLAYGDEPKSLEVLIQALDVAPDQFKPFLFIEFYKRCDDKQKKVNALKLFVDLIASQNIELSRDLYSALGLSKSVLGQALLGLIDHQQLSIFEQLLLIIKRQYFQTHTSSVAVMIDLAEVIEGADKSEGVKLLQYCESYCLTDETPQIDRIRLYRNLASSSDVDIARSWALTYLQQLNGFCPVEMLGESDVVAALNVISGGFHHKRHDLAEYFKLWQKFETTTNEKWPEVGVIYVFLRLQHAQSIRNESEALKHANALMLLMKTLDHTKVMREGYELFLKLAEDTIRKSRRKDFKSYNRNDKLLVKYASDEPVVAKFKVVEDDLYFARCTLIGRA